MELEAYRRSAQEFVESFEREYYRHYSGLDDRFEIEPIYARHEELFTPDAVMWLRELRDAAPLRSEERRRLGLLLDFAAEGHVNELTKSLEAQLAARETSLTIDLGGEQLGFRASTVAQANEPGQERRTQIERGRLELIDAELRPLYEEVHERRQAGARELGWASYRELCADCKALDLEGLHAQTEEFLVATQARYPDLLDRQLQASVGVGLAEARSADLPRLFRAPGFDHLFPVDRLVESFVETLAGLGIDLNTQEGVTLDIEPRSNKSPRAFCAPVRTPGEVYLVTAPFGGRDDFDALFHEGGHLEHAAHVDPELAFEFRYLGDNAITETYAFLFQHLVDDPLWLERRLGIADASALVASARVKRLVYLRRYCAKLSYELELQGGAPEASFAALRARYAGALSEAVGVAWPEQTFLADVDPGFYSTCYLRAWALEALLRSRLHERFGAEWWRSRAAGAELRALWREGQRITPAELLERLGGGDRLDFRLLAEELGA